jgi:hypothetical protein
LRYAEGETSEALRHFPISMLSASR